MFSPQHPLRRIIQCILGSFHISRKLLINFCIFFFFVACLGQLQIFSKKTELKCPELFLCHFQLSNNGLKHISRLQLLSLPNSDTSSLHLGLQFSISFLSLTFLWTEIQSFCLHLLLKAFSPQPQPRPLVSHQAHLHLAQKTPSRAFQCSDERSSLLVPSGVIHGGTLFGGKIKQNLI